MLLFLKTKFYYISISFLKYNISEFIAVISQVPVEVGITLITTQHHSQNLLQTKNSCILSQRSMQ